MSGDVWGCHSWGEAPCKPLASLSRSQECCSTSYSAQDRPPPSKEWPGPSANSAGDPGEYVARLRADLSTEKTQKGNRANVSWNGETRSDAEAGRGAWPVIPHPN